MRTTLSLESRSLELEFPSTRAAHDYLEQASRDDGFVLPLDCELKLFESLECSVSIPESAPFSFRAEVVQVFPSPEDTFGTAFQIAYSASLPLAALARALESQSEEPVHENPQAQHEAESSPTFRIREMNPNQRFRLALKASRIERQILLRDSQPQVLLGLLSNPHLEDKEVLEIAKSNFASAGVMQRLADNRKWIQNPELQLTLVKSQRTPPAVAQKLLPNLRTQDLRVLSKMGNAREVLRKAALRIYLQRTSKRPHG